MNGQSTSTSTSATHNHSQYPQSPQQLQQLLTLLLSSDNNQIKYATDLIQQWQKHDAVNSVTGLMQQLTDDNNSIQIKQIAAVLLRRRIIQQYKLLNNELKQSIKSALLQRLEHEQNRLVRHSIAALISTLAKITVPSNEWNELLELLLQWCNSSDAYKRELSMMLFRALAENIGQALKPHFKTLQNIFIQGLSDSQSDKVRIEAVYAIGVLVDLIDNDALLNSFKQVIQPLITVLHAHLQNGNEDLIAAGFDVLDTLAQSQVNILDTAIQKLIPLMIDVVSNSELDINIRDKAASLTASIIQSKPKTIIKLKSTERLLQTCIALLCEPDTECFEPSDETTIQRIGVEILDALTLYIPRKYIYQPCLSSASTLLQSSNEHGRKAGLIILSIMAEGTSEPLRASMSDIVPAMCNSLQDPSVLVRISACLALIQFAEHLQPEILEYHTYIIPRILHTMDTNNQNIQVCEKSITVLEVMLESMETDIVQYIEPVMTRLIHVLQHQHMATTFIESAINAIIAVAQAAGKQFIPYYTVTAQIILPYMQLNTDDALQQRCRATVCMGQIAYAVGKEQFEPLLQQTLSYVMNGMTLEYFELREASYIFFSLILQMLSDTTDCMSYITTIMPLILATCFSDDGVLIHKNQGSTLNEDSQSDSESDIDGNNVNISIRSGALDEKVAALQCMATCIQIAGDKYNVFLEKTIQVIDELIEYPHAYIRQAIMHVSLEIVKLMLKLYPIDVVKGQSTILPTPCKSVIEKIVKYLYDRIKNDEDKETVAVACDVLGETIQLYGLSAIQHTKIDKLYKLIQSLLQERATCQQNEYDEEDEDIVADHDSVLIDSVTDLIAYLAAATGPTFDTQFKVLLPMLLKFYEPTRQSADRSMAIGCIAEIVVELGMNIQHHVKQLLPLCIQGIQDNAIIVRRNAAYCYGNIAMCGLPSVIETYSTVLPMLQYMIQHKTVNKVIHQADSDEIEDKSVLKAEIDGAKDNAVSAICKIITVCMSSTDTKIQQILSYDTIIPYILNELPLTGDIQEAKYVYSTVMQLYHSKHDMMKQYTPQIFSIWSQVLGDAEIDTTIQKQMTEFIKQVSHTIGQPQTEQIVQQYVTDEHKQRFIQFLTS